jgi:hypothetical protein
MLHTTIMAAQVQQKGMREREGTLRTQLAAVSGRNLACWGSVQRTVNPNRRLLLTQRFDL